HMTEIAEYAFLPAATLTKLVDRLVDDNLVYRRIDPVDRRRIRAYLTPRGRDVYQRVHRGVQASWDHLATTTHDAHPLGELLARLIDALDRQPDPTALFRSDHPLVPAVDGYLRAGGGGERG